MNFRFLSYFYPALEQKFVPNNREEFQRLFFYEGNKIALQISSINQLKRAPSFLTREAHAQHELSWVVDKCIPRSMGCKLYAGEVRSQLTFKLLSLFN